MTAEVSHGRGGAGNFNTDDTQYVDGSVVRVGVEGSHGDGVYSAGRGGMLGRTFVKTHLLRVLHSPGWSMDCPSPFPSLP